MTFPIKMIFAFGGLELRTGAGPFRNGPPLHGAWYTIRLAPEVKMPANHVVPIKDFSVPTQQDAQAALILALQAAANYKPVYFGCFGGIGRTGTFLALLAKVQQDYERLFKGRQHFHLTPVQKVRADYLKHAVETSDQERFVEDFDTLPVIDAVLQLEKAATGRNEAGWLAVSKYRLCRWLGAVPRWFPAFIASPGAA